MRSDPVEKTALVGLVVALTRAVSAGETPVVDFAKLGPPKPGEWRHVFQEPAQSFGEYAARHKRLAPREWLRVSVVSFARETEALDGGTLCLLKEFLAAYFMTGTEVEAARPLPQSVRRRPSRGFGTQVLADDVLRVMADMTRDETRRRLEERGPSAFQFTLARLGIVHTDLYGTSPGGGYLNFVFGMGAYGRGVAVISPARYSIRYEGEPEGMTLRKRVFKVAAHEIGHVLGLAHCQVYKCCMNGSNSLPEADRRPIHLCPECLRKLQFHLCFDRDERYRSLERIYLELDWEDEAGFAARRAALEPELIVPGGKDMRE